jgi:hypothetical protein
MRRVPLEWSQSVFDDGVAAAREMKLVVVSAYVNAVTGSRHKKVGRVVGNAAGEDVAVSSYVTTLGTTESAWLPDIAGTGSVERSFGPHQDDSGIITSSDQTTRDAAVNLSWTLYAPLSMC